jgi:hypothetical protein
MAFATVALAELAPVYAMRSVEAPAWRAPRNAQLAGGVALSALAVVRLVYLPVLREPFGTVSLGPAALGVVLGFALAPLAIVELAKTVRRALV